jgi:glutathione S-transferase
MLVAGVEQLLLDRKEERTMSDNLTVYGFDASTYVRTVRMVLAEKEAAYTLVPVNVMAGEGHEPAHLARHPFGKVPVLDHDGLRLYETGAIARYLDDVLPGASLVPDTPRDRARMDMGVAIVDAYGYAAMIGVAAYHLFPELAGGKNEAMREACVEKSQLVLAELMKLRGTDPWIAGPEPTLADLFLAPICFYVGMTEDAPRVFAIPGFAEWWDLAQGLESFKTTVPHLG